MTKPTPKVFISYSWSSESHQLLVKAWADRLIEDGIKVILDLYDLKEGDDKHAFMEKMVTDKTVTHVLIFCDKTYAEKADGRSAGVGTESQIISEKVYGEVVQSKFIPIICEFDNERNAYTPTFLKSRKWIDFSSREAADKNWEQLIRLLYDKPLHNKPAWGKPPAYINDDTASPPRSAALKYSVLKEAILQAKPAIPIYRAEFLDECIASIDSLRVREKPNLDKLGEKILADCGQLKLLRDHIIDWVVLESTTGTTEDFSDILVGFLERLLEMKFRPSEIDSWNNEWFGAHNLFVYETFLYIIAALLKAERFHVLHNIFTSHYLLPEIERYGDDKFKKFDYFYGHSEILENVLTHEGQRYYSPAAELFSRQADRQDIPFQSVIEAELLIFLMILLTPDTFWYPGTVHHASHSKDFLFFLRAARHKGFQKLSTITGIPDADTLREAVKDGCARLSSNRWVDSFMIMNLRRHMNIDKFDTLK